MIVLSADVPVRNCDSFEFEPKRCMLCKCKEVHGKCSLHNVVGICCIVAAFIYVWNQTDVGIPEQIGRKHRLQQRATSATAVSSPGYLFSSAMPRFSVDTSEFQCMYPGSQGDEALEICHF